MRKWIGKYWLLLLIILQPFLDIVAYFQYDSTIGTMSGYIRLLFMIIIPLYAFLTTKRKKKLLILMGIIGCYCVLHVGNGILHGDNGIFQDISYLLKVIQMPVLGISFCYLFKNEKYKKQILVGFTVNFLIISLVMLIASISGTGLYTYDEYKIGYRGWFANANAQSIIIVTLIPFFIYEVIQSKRKVLILLALIISQIVLLANGTKAAYLSLFIIMIGIALYFIIICIMERQRNKKTLVLFVVVPLGLSIISMVVYPITPRYKMDTYAEGKRTEENVKLNEKKSKLGDGNMSLEEILADPEKKAALIECYRDELDKNLVKQFGVEVVLEAYGWWPDSYMLADVRMKKRINARLVWDESDIVTKIVGINFEKLSKNDLENDYAAIYYYYGYLGFCLYILFLLYFLLLVLKTAFRHFKKSFSLFNYILIMTYILQIGLAQFSGAILRRPNASIYMSIVIALIYYQCKNVNLKKDEQLK